MKKKRKTEEKKKVKEEESRKKNIKPFIFKNIKYFKQDFEAY